MRDRFLLLIILYLIVILSFDQVRDHKPQSAPNRDQGKIYLRVIFGISIFPYSPCWMCNIHVQQECSQQAYSCAQYKQAVFKIPKRPWQNFFC